ncbi:hypothetical protein DAPPUDRAFT_320305 [Daphnia pulex]|uniref:Uncharacterized protein n=1 Tax=Daphnia pulex TaxID=6669 RepID=E9GPH8_DAPPU|nr:hypothetical protein DAPPUDRAFT_320305 [Daphnia pulex]|eukprot:EFX78639.1 hypothetical protein DAPPUDRAFT_320305 [Daphnia pulex]
MGVDKFTNELYMPQEFFRVKVEAFFAEKQDPIDNHNFWLQLAIEDKNNERVNELPSSEINYGQEEYSDVGILETFILQFLKMSRESFGSEEKYCLDN